MEKDTDITRVVFRIWRDTGEVIAFFPDVPADKKYMMSYMHIGQHGEADYQYLIKETSLATPAEYKPLKEELESIGYHLRVVKRISRK